jgi:hypothetical protein
MSIQNPDRDWATGKYNVNAVVYQVGGRIARTGPGVYTLTLDSDLDATEGSVLIQSMTAGLISYVADTSDTVKTITFTAAAGGAATDAQFAWHVLRKPQGAG